MKPVCWICATVAAAALAVGAPAQESPYAQLKAYDNQNRAALATIERAIRDAGTDRAKLAAIETGVLTVLTDRSAEFAGKQEACKILWIVGSARSVPVLAQMLPDERLNDIARYALERIPDPSVGRALRAALAKAKGRALVGVVNSLGDRRDPDAVVGLAKLASSPDPLVRGAAVIALGKIGTAGSTSALKGMRNGGTPVAEALVRSAERMAHAAGGKAGSEPLLEKMTGDGNPVLARTAALQALVSIRSTKAGPAALRSLRSKDGHVAAVAARICGSLKDAATTRSALSAFPNLAAPVQIVLLQSFTDSRNRSVAPVAMKATQSPDSSVRAAAMRAAAKTAGVAAVPRLCEIATGGDGGDSGVARGCLATIGGKGVEAAILAGARSGKPEVRQMLVGVLAERPDAAVLSLLTETVQGPAGPVAREAARSLERVGGPAQIGALVKVVSGTKDDDVRDAARSAAVACAQRSENRDQAVAPVLAALPGAGDEARPALLRILAEVGGDQALAELARSTGDTNAEVKRAAIAALAETWGDSRPLPTLMAIAKSDESKSLRVQALRGCMRLLSQDEGMPADQKVARLREALALAERPEEKRQVLSVLRDCRVPSAVDMASAMLDDPDLFAEAADTVLYLAAKQRKNDRDQAAVTGPGTVSALTRVIEKTKDENQKTLAGKLREESK